jgi:hypothetical protein
MNKQADNWVAIYGSLFSALAVFHGPFRDLIGIEASSPPYSAMMLLVVVSFGLIYTLVQRDPLLWLFKNIKNNLHHPLIIATEFAIVFHLFLIHQIDWLNIVVSIAFTAYFGWVLGKTYRV